MNRVIVSDVMTREPFIIDPKASLLECAKKMVQKKTGSLLLVDKKKLVGLISRHDIMWALIKQTKEELSKIKAIEISPKKLTIIRPSATLDEALKKMKDTKFERLPVIDNNELVGIITFKDILSFHPEIYNELQEFADIREESRKLKLVQKAKERTPSHEGICSECGNQEVLYKVNGALICESCKNS
jgi:CBS domain-containing protein